MVPPGLDFHRWLAGCCVATLRDGHVVVVAVPCRWWAVAVAATPCSIDASPAAGSALTRSLYLGFSPILGWRRTLPQNLQSTRRRI